MFRRIYQADVPFTIHAGECGDYENVALAVVSYGARRIGHGCAAIRSEACMDLLKRNITLEMCIVSNLQTKGGGEY